MSHRNERRRSGAARRTRFERRSEQRQQRARAHWSRIQRRNARTQGRRPLIRVGIFSVALGCGALLALLLIDPHSRVWAGEARALETIAVLGNERLDAREVALATGLERGAPLTRVETADVEARLDRHPWIASSEVLALPTGRLLVKVTEQRAAALHRAAPHAAWRWIAGNGVAFAEAQPAAPERWHRILGEPPTAEADAWRAEAIAIAELAVAQGVPGPVEIHLPAPASPPKRGVAPGEGSDVDEVGWRLVPAGLRAEARLGNDGAAIPRRLARLSRLLSENVVEAAGADTIDLRFAEQAVLQVAARSLAKGESASR